MTSALQPLPKMAIVHEWLSIIAGSEKVVSEWKSQYPTSTLYSLVDFFSESERKALGLKADVTSFIQHLPFAERHFRMYLPLMPLAIEQFDLSGAEIVLSSHHAVAKGVLTHHHQLHICYCHSPMRYAWDFYHQYLRNSDLDKGLRGFFAKVILHYLRLWDVASVPRVDHFVANSHYIARRIKRVYGRDATVIYPPVDTELFDISSTKSDFYLAVARFVPYKKVDLIIDAFRRMPNRRLVVIGEGNRSGFGPLPSNVEILGFQEASKLRTFMQDARALIYAAEEDFGITIVEAQACGTPVIAFGRGGAAETVIDEHTGILFPTQDSGSLIMAVERFETLSWNASEIRRHAERFGRARFRAEFDAFLTEAYSRFLSHAHHSIAAPR